MGLSLEQAQIFKTTNVISYYEKRLMDISEEYQYKYVEGCAKTSVLTNQMNGELEAIEAELGDDPTSDEYRENLAKQESCQNEYEMLIENVRNEMNTAEQTRDTEQETTETKLEVEREQLDQWKEARDNTVETTCGYFED